MELVVIVTGLFVCLAAIVAGAYWAIRLGEHIRQSKGRKGFLWYLFALTLLLMLFMGVMVWVLYGSSWV